MVVTPDPTSITDAYALIKVLEQRDPGRDIRILVNQASLRREEADSGALIEFARSPAAIFDRDLSTWVGQVPRDRNVTDAVRQRTPFVSDSIR